MKVHVLGKWCSPWQNGKLIYEEARRQGLNATSGILEQPHKEILRIIDQQKPDWVFLTGSRTLPVEILEQIKQRAKLLLWDADANSNDRRKTWEERLHIPDIIITSVLAIAQEYKNKTNKIVWMPQYYDNTYYRSSLPENRQFDVVFLGGLDVHRKEILNRLSKKFKVAYHWHMFGEDMVDSYNQAKIAIGMNWLQTSYEYSGSFTTSDRIFKALGCGIFYLGNPIKNIELLFNPGEHLDIYDGTYENLEQKFQYWLEHEKERLEIAKQGQEEVFKNHTLKVRIHQYWRLMEDPNYTSPFKQGLHD
jgi:hypothetical protein